MTGRRNRIVQEERGIFVLLFESHCPAPGTRLELHDSESEPRSRRYLCDPLNDSIECGVSVIEKLAPALVRGLVEMFAFLGYDVVLLMRKRLRPAQLKEVGDELFTEQSSGAIMHDV